MTTFNANNNEESKYRSPRRFISSTNNIKQTTNGCVSGGGEHLLLTTQPVQLSFSSSISSPKSNIANYPPTGTSGGISGHNLDRIFSSSTTNTSSQFGSSKFSDIIESRFLNKLCEDIEVSLNVDCDCADDYSINDFSGDYSFDNELKSPIGMATATSMGGASGTSGSTRMANTQTGMANKYTNGKSINKSTQQQQEQNQHTNGFSYQNKRLGGNKQQQQQQDNGRNSPTKSQLGVLV